MPFGSMFMKPPKMGSGMGGGMQQQKQMPGIGGAISPTQPPTMQPPGVMNRSTANPQQGNQNPFNHPPPNQMPDLTGIRDPKTPYQTDPAPGTSREEMQQEYFRTGGKSGSLGGIISDEQMRGNRGNYDEMPQITNGGQGPSATGPVTATSDMGMYPYRSMSPVGMAGNAPMVGNSISPSTSAAMRQMYQGHMQRQRMQGPMPNVDPDTQPRVVNGLHMSPVKPQPGMSYLT